LPAYSRLLLTGAPGWLGDALLPKLGALGELRCLVDRSIPAERAPVVGNCVRGNLADEASLALACENMAGGAVVHAAGVIHPRRTSDWYRINRDGTLALARAAKAVGVRRFVFVSSNAAQGAADSREQLLAEDMLCKPLSHYGRSKHEAEQGLLKLHAPGVFDVVIARPCMFYGPPVPARHVDIFKRIQRGRLPMVGDGNYARSLTFIDDLVAGILLCLSHESAPGEVFNLCDERVYTTREVCEAMAAALKVPPRFFRIPAFSASIAYGVDCSLAALGLYSMPFHLLGEANWNVGCSSRKAVERLGYKTSVDVFEGYRRAVEWCRGAKLIQ
jgi:nucleoside-diphosphate-sugar epimerase